MKLFHSIDDGGNSGRSEVVTAIKEIAVHAGIAIAVVELVVAAEVILIAQRVAASVVIQGC